MAITLARPASAQCEYEITVLHYPATCGFGLEPITQVGGLNDLGWVVGYYQCPTAGNNWRGYLWTEAGGYQDLGMPEGAVDLRPSDINNHGVVVGSIKFSDTNYRGFLLDLTTGDWTFLLPAVEGTGTAGCTAINDDGTVVGIRSITENVNPRSGFVWSEESGFTDIGLVNGIGTAIFDINQFAQASGDYGSFGYDEAFIWNDGAFELIGPTPVGTSSSGGSINDLGQMTVIGVDIDSKGTWHTRSFIWKDGIYAALPIHPTHDSTSATGINLKSQVVGAAFVPGNSNDRRAFVIHLDDIVSLNDVVNLPTGFNIGRAWDINDTGQIIADGRDDEFHAVSFFLSPKSTSAGDITGDCQTDRDDLLKLLAHWGMNVSPADLNDDGVVNVVDLLFMLANWG